MLIFPYSHWCKNNYHCLIIIINCMIKFKFLDFPHSIKGKIKEKRKKLVFQRSKNINWFTLHFGSHLFFLFGMYFLDCSLSQLMGCFDTCWNLIFQRSPCKTLPILQLQQPTESTYLAYKLWIISLNNSTHRYLKPRLPNQLQI